MTVYPQCALCAGEAHAPDERSDSGDLGWRRYDVTRAARSGECRMSRIHEDETVTSRAASVVRTETRLLF